MEKFIKSEGNEDNGVTRDVSCMEMLKGTGESARLSLGSLETLSGTLSRHDCVQFPHLLSYSALRGVTGWDGYIIELCSPQRQWRRLEYHP